MKSVKPLIPATLLTALALGGCTKKEEAPNILLILLDDAGYADFGFMGCKDLKTPNIDELALQGTIFSDAHVVSTVSGPSRAALMTGRYGQRFGYECNPGKHEYGIPLTETTMGEVFQQAGYSTAAIGKWHLGSLDEQHPNNRGFDYFYGMKAGSREYFYNPDGSDKENDVRNILRNNEKTAFYGYLTDVFSDEAIQFITGADKPFFMYLSYNAVHTPMQAMEEDLTLFEGHPRQKLAAMTWALDRGIGKVIDALKNSGKFDNTLIFFLSDNGGAINNQSSNLPLKGFKGNKFEGGHRVPFFVVWGDKLKSPVPFNGLTSALDIFTTVMDAAKMNNNKVAEKLDGVSLLPYLKGMKQGNPHEKLFWRKMDTKAVRYGDYKLIVTKDIDTVLYNVNNDIAEMTNIRVEETAKYAELMKLIDDWEATCVAPLWIEEGWGHITNSYHERLMHNLIFEAKDLKK